MLSTKKIIAYLAIAALILLYYNLRLLSLSHAFDLKEAFGDSLMDGFKILPANRVVHVSRFGLGHRLIRDASAYHLAKSLDVARMKPQWGSCSKDTNWKGKEGHDDLSIFPYLFGNDVLYVPSPSGPIREGKRLIVRNDVYGYIPGQTYKSFELPIQPETYKSSDGPFLSKLASDSEFYDKLIENYVFKDQIDAFMEEHKFSEHEVIGIHLRFGNGEKSHFEWSGRGVDNEKTFKDNLMKLLQLFLRLMRMLHDQRFSEKEPLVFLATDTPQIIPEIVKATKKFGVKTVHFPQIRVEENKGVSFKAFAGKEQKCLDGWTAMVNDMMLLAHSDVLIAGQHSSFTQSLPMSTVFDRHEGQHGPHFCEVKSDGSAMTCLEDKKTWLFRDDVAKMIPLSIGKGLNGLFETTATHVVHRLLVHLPDTKIPKEFDDAKHFLQNPRADDEADILMHTYGAKGFNPKYRKDKPDLPSWNFV